MSAASPGVPSSADSASSDSPAAPCAIAKATSPATSPPCAHYCALCKVTSNSANDLERHLIGARHRKAVALAATAAAAPAAAATAAPRSLISSSSSSAVVPLSSSAVPTITAAAVTADPLSGCPKPRSTALHANSSSYPTQEAAVQREAIDTQGEQDSLAQKKVGTTQSASANISCTAASLHCVVCDRSFKREADLHAHLSSKQHSELLAAFNRGAGNACSFAFTLCRSALLYYPAASPAVTSKELPAHQAAFAAQLSQFIDGKNAHRSLLALQQSLARADWDSARTGFLLALEGGLSTLAAELRREGMLGDQLEADANEFDDEYADIYEGDGDWQDEEDELGCQ